jgi:hypothetical protein
MLDPKVQKELALTQARVEGMKIQALTKAQIEAQKQQQRMAQSEQRHAQKLRQDEDDHVADLRGQLTQGQVDTTIKDAKAASDIANQRMKTQFEVDEE